MVLLYKIEERNFFRIEKGRSILEIPTSFVVFDLETTGLDSTSDEIIEIGALKVVGNQVVDTFEMLVKPKSTISPFITNLTGITNEMVQSALGIEEVLPLFLEFVKGFVLIGHNVNFDVNFIYDASMKLFHQPFQNDFVDTLRLSRKLLKHLYRHKLGEIAHYYGVDTTGSHRSLKDVEMTLTIFYKLQEEILNQYGSFEAFQNSNSYPSVSSKEIIADASRVDPNHFFYKKRVVVTGTLEGITRREVLQMLRNIGALPEDQVTIQTDYLIVGKQKLNRKSTKLRMTESLQKSGYKIQIIPDSVFYKAFGIENKV